MKDDLLQRLQSAKSDDERSWLVTQNLLNTLPKNVQQAVFAAAIPHWFNSEILSSLLPAISGEIAEIYTTIQELPFAEPFQKRGWNIHETTRKFILIHFWENDPDQFKLISDRASNYFLTEFQRSNDKLVRNEQIYHDVIAKPETKGVINILYGMPDSITFLTSNLSFQQIRNLLSTLEKDKKVVLDTIEEWHDEDNRVNQVLQLELLEKYEPVLRFAKSERFFPMGVQSYLDKCSLIPNGTRGIVELIEHSKEPFTKRLGNLTSEQFNLRYVNNPLLNSDAWAWWGLLSILGIGTTWWLSGVVTAEIAISISIFIAIIIFIVASPTRLRITPLALAALFFIMLGFAPIWFFLQPSQYVSMDIEYLVLLPIYLLSLFYLQIRMTKFIFDNIISELPSMANDILSSVSEKIAQVAYKQYTSELEKDEQPLYYGRVLYEEDEKSNKWTILQYHFFYAFNDWRLAANGINQHEGDWELVAIYLKNKLPYAIAFSQHDNGSIERWNTVSKSVDNQGYPTLHPIVYVALGSHANYSTPIVVRAPKMHKLNKFQRLLYWVDGFFQFLFLLLNPNEKARQIALAVLKTDSKDLLSPDILYNMRDEYDHYLVKLPLEIASGDGFRVGAQGDNLHESAIKSSSYLQRFRSDRKTTRPKTKEWKRILLNPEPEWIQYKGLWGVKSLLIDDSGSTGPKWNRAKKRNDSLSERLSWSRPLDWLAELESNEDIKKTIHQE